ncbi:MAG: hypothetical protein V1824_00365 [archaeon]
MNGEIVNLNLKISNYGNRVLGVVKEKYGLKDKSQALERFIDMYGDEFVDREVREDVILDAIKTVEEMKKKNLKPTSMEELRKICGLKK